MSEILYPPGTAPVKAEYIIVPNNVDITPQSNLPTGELQGPSLTSEDTPSSVGKQLSKSQLRKEEKKKRSGAHKGRRFGKLRDDLDLCWKIASGNPCNLGDECRFTHDLQEYLEKKPPDIYFPKSEPLINVPPFVERIPSEGSSKNGVDPSTQCPVFLERGECRHGWKCRFLGGHVRQKEGGELELVKDEERLSRSAIPSTEVNYIGLDALKLVRSKKYPHTITNTHVNGLQGKGPPNEDPTTKASQSTSHNQEQEVPPSSNGEPMVTETTPSETTHIEEDTPEVPLRPCEKRRLHWSGKTYLAPLTTVGNLPFRRLCISYGADITCGEMGLATSFLSGSKEEWSLVRRHPSEPTFGVQLAGNKPGVLMASAEIMAKEFGSSNLDFVDLNCGCPIDLVFRAGSGSALLDSPGKLGKIVTGMNKVLGDIPLTVKLRTGVKDSYNNAHKLMPRLAAEWGVGAITVILNTVPYGPLLNSRYSFTEEVASRDTHDWRTGVTSSNAWTRCGQGLLMRVYPLCPSLEVEIVIPPRATGIV